MKKVNGTKNNVTSLIFDLSQIIIQKRCELLHVINPNFLKMLYGTEESTNREDEFKAELEKQSLPKMNWLNTNLNLSLWEVGKRINEESILIQGSIIHNIYIQLAKKHVNIFSETDLYTMAKFAKVSPDRTVALGISMLVRWEYFPVLLSLPQLEAMFFYAKLIATQGLSITELQTQITNNIFEQTNGAKERAQATIYALQNPVTKTKVIKKGNASVIGTTTYIDDNTDINPDVINIFKNPSLYLLTSRIKK